ncbi:mitochondrial distribution/morphology family 35/apoptosis [Globomyces pollinis-pini]|nr:mitochondrial distribution/morphology family 35/apoptosis [Globomyces pollinis-pini]
MASISPECNNLKQKYDLCFNTWYSEKYLQGDTTQPCQDLFKEYKACVWKNIKERNIDKLILDATKEAGIPLPQGYHPEDH